MGRSGRGAITAVLVLLAAACSSPVPERTRPTGDVTVATSLPIARTAADILLAFSAYDYALIGSLNGDKVRAVSADRFATVARAQAALVSTNTTTVVGLTVDSVGPVRDRLVALADGLTDLSRDALTYADAGDPAALARVLSGVEHGGVYHDGVHVKPPMKLISSQDLLLPGASRRSTARTVSLVT